MIRPDPILIAGIPRTGTTMLAGLLYHHGVWIGRSRTTLYPGTNVEFGSENIDIKNVLKREAQKIGYRNWTTPLPNYCGNGTMKKQIEKYIPIDTPWLVKTSWLLTFCDFWIEAYPAARWVFPFRKTENIIDSMNRHPGMRRHPDEVKLAFIQALEVRKMEIIVQVDRYITVDVEAVSRLKNDEIERLFLFLGIMPDYSVIEKWIEPERMKR